MEKAVPEIDYESLNTMVYILEALMYWNWTDVPKGEAYKYLGLCHELMLYSNEFCTDIPLALTNGLETFTRIFCAKSFSNDEPTFYFVPQSNKAYHYKKLAIAFIEWRDVLTEAGYPYPPALRQAEAIDVLNYPYLALINLLCVRFKRWAGRLEDDDSQQADWVRLTASLVAYLLAACKAGHPLEIKEDIRHGIYQVALNWMRRGFLVRF